jgi:acyl-CoA synthetase (NDP forming)
MTFRHKDLRPLFDPTGVVVAGASTHPGKFGFVALHNLLAGGYPGRVFATNLQQPTILGIDTLASVDDVPEGAADLVMVCAPAPAVPDVLRSAARRGIRAAFVVSGGYRELGESGIQAERDLVTLADELGIVMAGPNGQGLVSTPAQLWSQIVAPYPPAGAIAIASQSGNLVSTLMNLARQSNVGVSRAVSAGNQAILSIGDYLEYFAHDDQTAAAITYVEGVEDGRAFYEALRVCASAKPVVVVKGGVSASGAAAAASHTGSLATDDRVFDGMVRQAGAVRAPGVDTAFAWAAAFATQPLPAGPRTVVLTTAGGWGVLTADAIASSSLDLIDLPPDLHDAIGELVPPRWSRGNPIDLAGGETRDTIPEALDRIAAHPEVDNLIYLGLGIQGNTARAYRESSHLDEGMERIASFHERQETRYAKAAIDTALRHGKPILVASELGVADPDNPGPATMRELGHLCHQTPVAAVAALDAMWRYAKKRSQILR